MFQTNLHKSSILILLILLFLPILTLAADATPPANPMNDPVLRLVITENLKTREDLKSYIDAKIQLAGEALQKAVDDNFVVLDQRLNDFAIKLAIKLGIIWFSTTFLSILTVEIFFRKVYARAIKSRRFQEENTPQTQLSPDIQTMVVEIYDKMVRGHGTPADPAYNPLPANYQEAVQANTQSNQIVSGNSPTNTPTPAALSQTTPVVPHKIGFWERHKLKKQAKREAKHQKKLAREAEKLKKKLEKEAKKREIEKARNPPVPKPPTYNYNQNYNPNIQTPDKSYIDHTHDRIQTLYERQKIDQANVVNPNA